MSAEEERLRAAFCEADQGHIFRFWDELTDEQRKGLLAQLGSIDLDQLNGLIERHLAHDVPVRERTIEPASVQAEPEDPQTAFELGEESLAEGRVAVVIVAGGQATRLGYDGPKGTFPITPVTGKSLFELHAEKVRALSRRYGAAIPLIFLVSPHNREASEAFFSQHEHFQLPPDDLVLIEQGMLPAVDHDGQLLLADRGRIFLSPDGHGGVHRAFQRNDLYRSLEARGVDTVFYLHVDNPLVRIGDPLFLGMHRQQQSQFSLKVVRRRDASEKVGVYANVDGRPGVIEYSDLPIEIRDEEEHGGLRYWAGSIGIHVLDLAFMESVARTEPGLPYHMARKRVPSIDDGGQLHVPSEPNGFKFEAFVFDALAFAERSLCLETRREEEFAPVKRREGADSPETAIRAQADLYRSWLEDAGVLFQDAGGGGAMVEIGPMFALDRDELVRKIREEGIGDARKVLLD